MKWLQARCHFVERVRGWFSKPFWTERPPRLFVSIRTCHPSSKTSSASRSRRTVIFAIRALPKCGPICCASSGTWSQARPPTRKESRRLRAVHKEQHDQALLDPSSTKVRHRGSKLGGGGCSSQH